MQHPFSRIRFSTLCLLLTCVSPIAALFASLPASVEHSPKSEPSDATDVERWFPFQPPAHFDPARIGMNDWFETPSGSRGFVQIDGNNLRFEDGTPVKFWGTNLNESSPFAGAEMFEHWIAQFRKYGINAVRFHKFTWDASDGHMSTVITTENWENFDAFTHRLKEEGIYHGWSHIYGHRVRPGDRGKLVAYEEIANLNYPWQHLSGSTSALVNFAPDLQDLSIELTVHMLNHRNPHTGLRYADDPSLAFIEFQNEDNIFWGAILEALNQTPTYRAMLCEQFSDWLIAKYGSDEALISHWGRENLPEAESLAMRNVFPHAGHSGFEQEYQQAHVEGRRVKAHFLDKMQFLYEAQVAFYQRFTEAVRATGYKGVLVGSCWQAGAGLAHFYNLHADAQVGMIDRHNYFGGGTGHLLTPGKVRHHSMLSRPGIGLLSAGMQQVEGLPFALSEWMSLLPNEWIAEGPAIIAAYGMGLQGWDASFHFGTDLTNFSQTVQSRTVYNVTSPTQMGLYPALARMVLRGDVREADVISRRKVHVPSLAQGALGFHETIEQGYDNKFITGDIPAEALARGRLVVEFVDAPELTEPLSLNALTQGKDRRIDSSTGELSWDYRDKGYFTIDTAATQGVVGHAANVDHFLSDITLTVHTPFAITLLTARSPEGTLQTDSSLLLTTIARARNTGMRYNEDGTELLNVGSAPILLEPVELTLQLPERATVPTVHVLDHGGTRTGHTLPVTNNTVHINGVTTHAIYYEITY
ncbi:MAG: hypothetical protein ABQ298_13660 [Puniceicoccaceae bacterium]